MAITLDTMADTLQTLFTTEADQAAKESGMIRRRRKISGAGFVQTLVFGWLDDPKTTIEDLGDELGLSKQGLDQRLDDRARRLSLAGRAGGHAAAPRRPSRDHPLVAAVPRRGDRRLHQPGAAGGAGPAVPRLWRHRSRGGPGRVEAADPLRGHHRPIPGDGTGGGGLRACAGQAIVPRAPGEAALADLGFFDLDELAGMTQQGVSWISRVPALLDKEADDGASEALTDWLRRQPVNRIDQPVRLGARKHLDCRLVAVRLPRKVAQQRLRELKKKLKKKGRTLSARQRVLCQWLVLITDLAADRFYIEEIYILYRVRWQIELLFKRWKSLVGLGRSRGRRAYRVLCETYAKLLGCLVQHWGTLLHGGPLSRTSEYRRAKQVRRFATKIAEALDDPAALLRVIGRLAARLRRMPSQSKSRRRPSTRQMLFGARLKTQNSTGMGASAPCLRGGKALWTGG